MLELNALKCLICGDVIFPRARHDYRGCTCGNCFVDGELYMHCGGKESDKVKDIKFLTDITRKEFYDDWNLNKDKYGLIKDDKFQAKLNNKLIEDIQKSLGSGKHEPVFKGTETEKSIKRGIEDIKKGRVTRVNNLDKFFEELDDKRKSHPIYYFFHDLYYRIYRFVKRIPLNVKTFVQRGKRGWGNSDTWGFDYYLSKVICEGVRNLKENVSGWPGNLTEGQWIDILNKIAYTFELAKQISENELYLIKDIKKRKKWQETLDKINKEYKSRDRCMTNKEIKEYEEGWKLFKEHFFNLWD